MTTPDPITPGTAATGCHPAVRCSDRPELCPPACHAEWHVAIHADSDSLFRHPGTLFDCPECRVLQDGAKP